jgi:hypothetical protein
MSRIDLAYQSSINLQRSLSNKHYSLISKFNWGRLPTAFDQKPGD